MSKPLIGFTYPTVTSETPEEAFARILGEYPRMGVWSVYYDGHDLPTWTEDWFDPAYEQLVYLVSVKHPNVALVAGNVARMPEHLRGRVVIFLHHEPDQWRSATDHRGDPDPATWKQRQVDFANLRDRAEWRNWIWHAVCFTEDRYRRDTATWELNWGDTFSVEPRIDFVAFDCFNIGRSIIRPAVDMFKKPLEFARRVGRKLIIRELGQVVPTDTALDSPEVAAAVDSYYDYAVEQNAVDEVFWALVWYNNHNNTLKDPSGKRPGRPLTAAALAGIVEDAAPDEPDPSDPQYVYGWNDRDRQAREEIAAARAEGYDSGKAFVVDRVREVLTQHGVTG